MQNDGHHGAHLDFSQRMSYGDYLALEQLLSMQHPLTERHDELLFVIQHQVSELWMKLVLHELLAAREHIKSDDVSPALKKLARVTRTFEQLISAWTVLTTLTPSEYESFRGALGQSSGFQSFQYRMIEFILGNKNPTLLEPHRHHQEWFSMVYEQLLAPSLYDEVARLLSRNGFVVDQECLERDWTRPYEHNASLENAWLAVYKRPDTYWKLYELAEKLVDIEDAFRQWRFRHLTTVERIIGFKTGTGGTSGAPYLRKMLDVVLFPELWRLRTLL